MLRMLTTAAALALASAAAAQTSDTATETAPADAAVEAPVHPLNAKALPSDGLAECAAALAAASQKSNSRIERENLESAAGDWFAASFDTSAAEGRDLSVETLGQKTSEWAGRLGSAHALSEHADWMAYCAHLAGQHALDPGPFAAAVTQ